jgi:hypothetical protein
MFCACSDHTNVRGGDPSCQYNRLCSANGEEEQGVRETRTGVGWSRPSFCEAGDGIQLFMEAGNVFTEQKILNCSRKILLVVVRTNQ